MQGANLAASLLRARQLCAQGSTKDALLVAKRAAAQAPSSPEAQHTLGVVYQSMRRTNASLKHLRKAVRLAPRHAPFRASLAVALVRAGKHDEGLREADEALETDPHEPSAIKVKGDLLRTLGRFEEASELLEAEVEGGAPPALVSAYVKTLRALRQHERSVDICRQLLADADLHERDRVTALFDLGASLDALGEYDDAWDAIDEANRLHTGVYDPEAATAWAEETMRLWTRERIASLPISGMDAELPVFIVGMPRSGTTLIEQIIAAHPAGAGAGERQDIPIAVRDLLEPTLDEPTREARLASLNEGALRRLAADYATSLLEATPGRSVSRIADKQMRNALHLGLISRAFPAARAVACSRHPLDVVVSCYFSDFGEPSNLGFVYDISHTAHEIRLVRRLIDHWRDATDLRIHDADYEAFTAEPEAQTRTLIGFLGLDWDDACLSFHEAERAVVTLSFDQVRRPMYRSSVGRWRRYEKQLGPAIEALGDALER